MIEPAKVLKVEGNTVTFDRPLLKGERVVIEVSVNGTVLYRADGTVAGPAPKVGMCQPCENDDHPRCMNPAMCECGCRGGCGKCSDCDEGIFDCRQKR